MLRSILYEVHKSFPANPLLHWSYTLTRQQLRLDEASTLREAIRVHFVRQLQRFRRELRQLINRGWISLGIGLAFLGACLIGGEIVSQAIGLSHITRVLQESLVIGGWVAMWRPLEIFLYDWWPIVGKCRLYERLSQTHVRTVYKGHSVLPQSIST